jgi:hypothetical protein
MPIHVIGVHPRKELGGLPRRRQRRAGRYVDVVVSGGIPSSSGAPARKVDRALIAREPRGVVVGIRIQLGDRSLGPERLSRIAVPQPIIPATNMSHPAFANPTWCLLIDRCHKKVKEHCEQVNASL